MSPLDDLIGETLSRPVPPEIMAMAQHVRSCRHGVAAVLAYGSCLRGVATTDSLIDLYVLTDDLRSVGASLASRIACAVAPPNVYYAEHDVGGRRYRAKYAVLPHADFARWMTARNPYFWARFAQPAALLFATDRAATSAAVATAVRTMYAHAVGLNDDNADPLAAWAAGFAATYGTELRAEANAARAAELVAANAAYYRRAAAALPDVAPIRANWALRRLSGKLWSVARLAKAAFTFTGGADYIVWKIERHSGEKIALTDWQRRHPILAGACLLPRLLRRGAVK